MKTRNATAADAPRCFEIETAGYTQGEAASLDRLSKRIDIYPQGFLVLEVDGMIVSFINSGCAHEVVMSDDAFKALVEHDPAAPNAVILSVVTAPEHQGRGYAKVVMAAFIEQMTALGKQTIHLMCKKRHIAFYEALGYRYVQPSLSEHGGMQWHEMIMRI